MVKADCRLCIYFVPVEKLSLESRVVLERWVERNRPNEPLLGFCKKFRRPVTYYVGECHGFQKRVMKQLRLDDYVSR